MVRICLVTVLRAASSLGLPLCRCTLQLLALANPQAWNLTLLNGVLVEITYWSLRYCHICPSVWVTKCLLFHLVIWLLLTAKLRPFILGTIWNYQSTLVHWDSTPVISVADSDAVELTTVASRLGHLNLVMLNSYARHWIRIWTVAVNQSTWGIHSENPGPGRYLGFRS